MAMFSCQTKTETVFKDAELRLDSVQIVKIEIVIHLDQQWDWIKVLYQINGDPELIDRTLLGIEDLTIVDTVRNLTLYQIQEATQTIGGEPTHSQPLYRVSIANRSDGVVHYKAEFYGYGSGFIWKPEFSEPYRY